MIVNMEWAEDGMFILSDGSYGNPGCECGENNAIVKIDGEYMCYDAYRDWIDLRLNK